MEEFRSDKDTNSKRNTQRLWYRQPAESFSQALPIGNGSFGAMVYGGYPREKMTLNMDTLWSGNEDCWKKRQHIPEGVLESVRGLIWEGKYFEAGQKMKETMLGTWNESYTTAGSLEIEYLDPSTVLEYERELCLDTALSGVRVRTEGGMITGSALCSAPADALAVHLTSETKPVSARISINTPHPFCHRVSGKTSVCLHGVAPSHIEPNYIECHNPVRYDAKKPGMRFSLMLGISMTDGKVHIEEDGSILAEDFTRLTLLVLGETGYRGYKRPLEDNYENLDMENLRKWGLASAKSWEQLEMEHIRDYSRLYGRVELVIRSKKSGVCNHEELPTDIRLDKIRRLMKAGGSGQDADEGACGSAQDADEGACGIGQDVDDGAGDTGLFSLMFQYGRYLMIASSRPVHQESQPANLQGIWCEDVRPVWSSNWTTNINTEMNYWLCGPCSLPECEEPLFHMLDELRLSGKTAAEALGCRGFAVHHNTDLWRQAIPAAGEVKWAFWPMGGIWLAQNLYQYYLYRRDEEFLRERAYPVYRDCLEFIVDYLVQGPDGGWHTCPSTSPENTFLDELGRECCVSASSAMDVALVREVLENMREICSVLGIEDSLGERAEEILKGLPGYQTGKYGQLREWLEDFEEADPGHRHFAHLAGFHPMQQVSRYREKELLTAVRRTIERRTENRRIHIGWNAAWLVNFYARLQDPQAAESCLLQMLGHSVYDNLLDLHPPLGEGPGEREIFQIDGNLGAAAGIAELLMQSSYGQGLARIDLLSALPRRWTSGRVTGLTARGGFRVSIEWKDRHLAEAHIGAAADGKLKLSARDPFTVLAAETVKGRKGRRTDIQAAACGGEYTAEMIARAGEVYLVLAYDKRKMEVHT